MFGEPGRAYVYFIYGMYQMLNFVTEAKGTPGAVLIRALEPVDGLSLMRKRRGGCALRDLTSGPGKLAQALGIGRSHNRMPLQGPGIVVWSDGFQPQRIMRSKRVGIRLATELHWRFFIDGNPFVSRARENAGARLCKALKS